MILAFDTRPETAATIAAAVHPYDKSCRPHVVYRDQNPDYHRLISCFHERTGIGAILNTSFNLHGFPVVYRPVEAIDVFDRSGLQYLALGNHLVAEVQE
jgi:carbamoyltransferase